MTIAAYGPDLARSAQGATLELSAPPDVGPTGLAGDDPSRGYRFVWQDGTVIPMGCRLWRSGPQWLQLAWPQPVTLTDVVVRMPILILMSQARRELADVSLEWWDGEWRRMEPVNGQPNPVLGWTAPAAADGSERRTFELEPIVTDRIRVVIGDGNAEGWCFVEDVEAYAREAAAPPLAVAVAESPADEVVQPGDERTLAVRVTDAAGRAVRGQSVSFAAIEGGGGVVDESAVTDHAGRAEAVVRTGPAPGPNVYEATIDGASGRIVVRALPREEALSTALTWLERAAGEHQRGSRVTALDGTVLYTPDGVASYDGFWVRDFQYMVEGHPQGIPLEHVRAGFAYLIARQRDDGAMPNKVMKNGVAVFCPGPGCDSVFGPLPPPDNPSFMVKLAESYTRLSDGDLSLFEEHRDALVRGMEFLLRSPTTSLIYIPPENPSSPYGFSDAIAKTGDQLLDSLLFLEASRILAELFGRIGDDAAARRWAGEAADVERDLQTLHDPASGMFFAASVDCRQIDVWGSAYAAHIGAIPAEQQRAVAEYLVANYDGIVRHGQVRHTAPAEYWQRTIVPNRDVYQNGTYWATPSGWVASVIATADRGLAEQMLIDLVKDYQRNGINEAINPDVGYVAIPYYVANAANPIPALAALAAATRV